MLERVHDALARACALLGAFTLACLALVLLAAFGGIEVLGWAFFPGLLAGLACLPCTAALVLLATRRGWTRRAALGAALGAGALSPAVFGLYFWLNFR